jgi:hypothetical protein
MFKPDSEKIDWDIKTKTVVNISDITLQKNYDEIEHKLAHLILEDIIFCNNGWWFEKENKFWPKDSITLHVNCNDVFWWGCADSENITHSEIHDLYEHFRKDQSWGPAIWCIKKRKQIAQKPVEESIKRGGIWDLEEIYKDFNENKN